MADTYSELSEIYASTMDAISRIDGVESVAIENTGGNVWAIGVQLPDKSFFLVTDSDGLELDRSVSEGWVIGHYLEDGEWDETFGYKGSIFAHGFTSDESASLMIAVAIAWIRRDV